MLRQHLLGAGERRDRPRDPRDPRPAAARQRQPLDRSARAASSASCVRRSGGPASRARPATTRSRTGADASAGPAASSSARGRGTVTTRSKRSSSARESLSRNAASRCGEHEHSAAGSPRAAARDTGSSSPTSWKRAGKSAWPARARRETTPSSSGCRSASSAGRWNSGSSSRSSTPRCARLASPGRGPGPPPTIAAVEALWCGARNGRRVTSGRSGGSSPRPSGSASPRAPRAARAAAGSRAAAGRASSCPCPAVRRAAGCGRRPPRARAPAARAPDRVRRRDPADRAPALLVRRLRAAAAATRRGGTRPPRARCRTGTASTPASSASQRRLGGAEDPLEPGAPRSLGHRERAAHRPDAPVERELADGGVLARAARPEPAATPPAPRARSGGRSRTLPCAGPPERG